MLVKGAMGLGIRERKPVTDSEKFHHKSIKEWIEHLPKANLGETSRQTYSLLLESNQQLLTTSQRNDVLSNLNEIVTYISNGLTKHYVGQSVSLSEKQQKVANFSQALDIEVAIGYKTIIEDLVADEKFQSNLLIIAINACMFYFYKIQMRCYQLYRDLPAGMWHEMHVLYQLAEQNDLHENKINLLGTSLNIKGTYKNILLLSTTNPNQLRQTEISEIAKSLSKVSHKYKLDSAPDGEYDFIVNLNSDAAPFHRSLLRDEMKANYRGFYLRDIVTELEHELQHKEKQQRLLGLSDRTQRHLLQAWGALTTRTFARTPGQGSIQVSIGLTASHHLINEQMYGGNDDDDIPVKGEKLLDTLEGSMRNAMLMGGNEGNMHLGGGKQKSTSWSSKSNAPVLKEDSMWDSLYRKKETLTKYDDSKPYQFIERAKDDPLHAFDYKTAAVINISPGGFCLLIDAPLPKQTQAGEIIGLLETSEDGEILWNIGTIRWMKRMKDAGLELGVQLIAPNGIPVRGQLLTSHANDNHFQRCLMLPAIDSIGQPQTILTSPLPFKEQVKVRIRTHEGEHDILLKSELFSGHNFKQFTYDVLETEPEKDTGTKDDGFDAVWDII